MYKNKKAISEIVSYMLLSLLVISIASATYLFAQNFLEDVKQEQDYSSMDSHFRKISYLTQQIRSFDSEKRTYYLSFSTGQIEIRNSLMTYSSAVDYKGEKECIENICYDSRNDFGIIYMNLTNNYNFSNDMTITPGEYFIELKHNKNNEEINVAFK